NESQGSAYGPFLADQNGPTPNGYFFQVGGDGSYAGGLMFGQMIVTIGYQGGRDLTSSIQGYFCSDFATLTPTPTVPTATPTDVPTATMTPTPQPILLGH